MKVSPALRRHGRAIALPTVVGNAVLALLAGGYASFFLALRADSLALFLSLTVAAAALLLGVQAVLLERWLRPLRRLLSGAVEPSAARGLEAVGAVWRHPIRVAVSTAAMWGVGLAAVLGGYAVLTGGWSGGLTRVVPIGLTFAGMSSAVVGVHTQLAVQRLLAVLCAELPVSQVLRAAPPDFRTVRLATGAATVAMVAVPMLLLIGISVVLQDDLLAEAVGALGTGQAPSATRLVWPLGALGLLVAAVAVTLAWGLGTALAEPLQGISLVASRVAKGELSRSSARPGFGEVWRVSSVFARLLENLAEVMGHVHRAEGRLSSSVGTLTESARRFQGGAERQASGLNQTSATTEELAHSARQIAGNATAVLEIAQKTLGAAEAGQKSAEAFRSAVARMQQDNASIAGAVERLRGRVQQIGRIIEFINSVAERSDLLALSAELEGTRAGEVGRGFGLVATEMRRLAENVLESTGEVEELIAEIRDATKQTAWATERAAALAASSTGQADGVLRSLTSVAELALRTTNAARTISLATQQQQSGTDQLAEAMSDVLGVTQQSLGATRQLGVANQRLEALAASLRGLVERFRVAG